MTQADQELAKEERTARDAGSDGRQAGEREESVSRIPASHVLSSCSSFIHTPAQELQRERDARVSLSCSVTLAVRVSKGRESQLQASCLLILYA